MACRNSALFAAMMVPALMVSGLARAEDVSASREATIVVNGEGNSSVAPDMAVVTMAVVKQAETADKALKDNNEALAQVLSAVKVAGVADKDIQTTGFSIAPNYRQINDGGIRVSGPEIIGYTVTNTVTLRLRDLSKVGGLLDSAIKLGINQGGQVAFLKEHPQDTITEARKAAMRDAMDKARTLAEAAGVSLGRLIEVNENFTPPMPAPMMRAAKMSAADESVPIASGENTYSVTVNVTFGIKQ